MRRLTALLSILLVLYGDVVYALFVPVNPNAYQPSATLTKVVVGGSAGAALVASGVAFAAYGGAALTFTELGSLTASGAVHGGIIGFAIEKNPNSTSTSLGGSSSTVTGPLAVVLANPNAPVPSSTVPAGWTQPTSGAAPVPPILQTGVPQYGVQGAFFSDSPQAACDLKYGQGYHVFSADSICGAGGTACGIAGPIQNGCITKVYYCPAGYTGTGTSSCNLQTASQVQKPAGSTEVIKPVTGTTPVAHDSQLPANQRINGLTVTANNVTFKDPDSGDTLSADFDSTGQMTKMTISVPSTSPNSHAGAASASSGTSQASTSVDIINLSADSSNPGQSTVTGTSHQTYSGTGSGQSSTPIQQVEGVGGSGSSLQLPTDYARTGEAQSAANSIKQAMCGGTGQPKCQIDETGTPSTVSDRRGDVDGVFDSLDGLIHSQTNGAGQGLGSPAVGIFSRASDCTDPAFTISDTQSYVVPICSKRDELQPLFRWFMYVITALAIYALWFRKLGGS